MLYSRGDHAFYRRLVAIHYLVFTAGCALCAPLAYGLYDEGRGRYYYYLLCMVLLAVYGTVSWYSHRWYYEALLLGVSLSVSKVVSVMSK